MKKILCFILIMMLALSSTLLSCGGKEESDSESGSEIVDADEGLEFSVKKITLYEGDNFQPELEGLEEGETVKYSTYDGEIVSVADNGLISALSVGIAVVKATSSTGRTALMQITVKDASMKVIPIVSISKSDLNLVVGDCVEVTAKLTYDGKTVDNEIEAHTENEEVATYELLVNEKGEPTGIGVVTAVGEGATVITFVTSYEGQKVKGSLNVVVNDAGMIICPGYAGACVYAGNSIELGVAVMVDGEEIEVDGVSYSVSDTAIAIVNGNVLTARNIGGDVTVSASFNYEGKGYTVESSVHVYGKFKVEIYSRGELDRTLFGRMYGERITLALLNPVDGREIKAWYVGDEKVEGNSFIMEDNDVTVTAVYANDTEDDFSSRFTQSKLLNDSIQGAARFVEQEIEDTHGNVSSLKGAVMINTANWSSLLYSFDSGVKVTKTAYIKMRMYVPTEAALIYLGISDGDGHNTWLYHDYGNIDQSNPPAHSIKITPLEWSEVIIPMNYLSAEGSTIAGFSICVSSNSYCLIDSIELYY